MSDLKCPYCHNSVPRGAFVCRGCHAEVKYGPRKLTYGLVAILAIFVGIKVEHVTTSTIGWIAIGIALAGGIFIVRKVQGNRVVFKRVSRS